jgi:decaprenyl-phosphate phosphoribosyltransferase
MLMTPYITLLRPKQWIKNAFVFAPLFFAHQFLAWQGWGLTIIAALCFISISCVVYICNDLSDANEDREHPVKRLRPLAAGTVTTSAAKLLAIGFLILTIALLSLLPASCTNVAVIYLILNIAYTLKLKHIAIIDVFAISSCYVLRVLMGCFALAVVVSPWIILTTFLLALFLGFGKRYHELSIEGYIEHKPNLQQYNRGFLDRLVNISGGAALLTYAIYTAEISRQIGQVELVYTTGFVAFGLFRYLQSIYVHNQGGEPENIILKDRLQQANIALWLITTLWILS